MSPLDREFQAFRQMGLELKPITVAMPRRLTLDDIDWNNSRPFAPWEGTGAWKWVSLHPLDLIEVCRADVIRVLCRAGSGQVRRVANAPVLDAPIRRHKRSPEVERANRALTAIYPEGVPHQATVRDNKLNNQVNDWLRDNSLDPVTIDSVLRGASPYRPQIPQVTHIAQWLKSLCSLIAANRLFGPTCFDSSLLRKYPSERLVRREKKSRARTLNRSDVPSLAKACWTSPAVGPKRLGNSRPANDASVSAAACCAISPRSLRLPRVRTWRSTAFVNAPTISRSVGLLETSSPNRFN